jgi:hypothetical protein
MPLSLANAAIWKRQATRKFEAGLGLSTEYPESMRYNTRSLRSLAQALQGPVKGMGIGIVGSVLGLACHDVRPTFHIHSRVCADDRHRSQQRTGSAGRTTSMALSS